MGYAELGDYRNVKTGQKISDFLYNRMPSGLRSGYVKIVVESPPPPPPKPTIPTRIPTLLKPVVPLPPPPKAPSDSPTGMVQAAAPLVAAAAGPIVGPIAAAIPPVVDTVTQPAPTRIRIVPDSVAPSVSLTPTPTTDAGGGSVPDTSLPSVSEASATETATTGSPLDLLKSVPPVVLAGIAGLVLFTFSRGRR